VTTKGRQIVFIKKLKKAAKMPPLKFDLQNSIKIVLN